MYNIAIEFKRGEPLQATITEEMVIDITKNLLSNAAWIVFECQTEKRCWIICTDEIITINMMKGEEEIA